MDNSNKYYTDLSQRMFSDTPLDCLRREDLIKFKSRVTFELNREFNRTAYFVLFDFITELYQEFGKPIIPIEVKDSCISCTCYLPDVFGWNDKQFRFFAVTNQEFHSIFRRYNLNKIFFHSFPDLKSNLDNIDCNRFEIDISGQPKPY